MKINFKMKLILYMFRYVMFLCFLPLISADVPNVAMFSNYFSNYDFTRNFSATLTNKATTSEVFVDIFYPLHGCYNL